MGFGICIFGLVGVFYGRRQRAGVGGKFTGNDLGTKVGVSCLEAQPEKERGFPLCRLAPRVGEVVLCAFFFAGLSSAGIVFDFDLLAGMAGKPEHWWRSFLVGLGGSGGVAGGFFL